VLQPLARSLTSLYIYLSWADAFLKIQAKYGETDVPKPQFTVIIVAKKHHQRFFPNEDRARDRKGNCKAGAVFE